MTLSTVKEFAKKYSSFFEAISVLIGIVLTRVFEFDPYLGVLAYTLPIVLVVIVVYFLDSKEGRLIAREIVSQVLKLGADINVGVGFGSLLLLGIWWGFVFLIIHFGVAIALISVRNAVRRDDGQRGQALNRIISEHDFAPNGKPAAFQDWFREEDLNLFSNRHSFMMAAYGGLVGLVVSTLIMVYAGALYTPLFLWFWSGVEVGTVLVASLGLFRNRVLKRVAASGFPAVFRFGRIAFAFYIESVLTGALGLGYGYGYVSAQSTILVLPFAGLFILFLYLYLLWRDILVRSEEGRLCIFQFIVEHCENGNGYSWLKRGLSKTTNMLESFGVSAKRNSLYFGSSYSLLEGSYLEGDLDNIYFLGDWTSSPNEMKLVHEIVSWFLHRSTKAEKRGFSRVFTIIDHLYELSPQSLYYIIAAVGAVVTIITAVLRR